MAVDLHPHEDVGQPGIGQAVGELGEAALPQHRTEAAQAAGLLGDLHRQQRFALCSQCGLAWRSPGFVGLLVLGSGQAQAMRKKGFG